VLLIEKDTGDREIIALLDLGTHDSADMIRFTENN
jgi:hypothetical protein